MNVLAELQTRLRGQADPDAVARLEKLRPGRACRDFVLDWALIAAAVTLVALLPERPWTWIVAFVLVGGGQYRLFVLGHEALHGLLHPRPAVNDRWARWLVYGPLFVGFDDSRRGHLAHHRTVGSKDDPERYIHALADKSSRGRMLLFFTGLATFTRTVQLVLPRRAFTGQRELLAFARQRIPVFAAQAVLLSALWLAGLPLWAWLVLWVAPIYVFVFVADEVRTLCDHAVPALPDEAHDRERLVTYDPNAVEAWVFSPHAVSRHAEHHLWPSVPYYNLEAAARLTEGMPEVERRKGYVGFLVRLWRELSDTA